MTKPLFLSDTKLETAMLLQMYGTNEFHETDLEWYGSKVKALEGMVTETKRIQESKLLTEAGRQDAMKTLRQKTAVALLPDLKKMVERCRAGVEQEVAAAVPKPKEKDLQRQFLEFEIRQALRGRDPLENLTTALEAIEQNDELTLYAILDAPRFFNLLKGVATDQITGAIRTVDYRPQIISRLEERAPNAERIADLKHGLAIHSAMYEALIRDISVHGSGDHTQPMPDDMRAFISGDPVAALAN